MEKMSIKEKFILAVALILAVPIGIGLACGLLIMAIELWPILMAIGFWCLFCKSIGFYNREI